MEAESARVSKYLLISLLPWAKNVPFTTPKYASLLPATTTKPPQPCTAKVVWFRGRWTSLACRRPGHSSLRVDHVRRRSSSSACAGIPCRSHLHGGCRRTRALATSRPAERQRRWHAASAVRAARTTTCSAGRAPCGSTRSRACRRSSTPSGSPRCHEPRRQG